MIAAVAKGYQGLIGCHTFFTTAKGLGVADARAEGWGCRCQEVTSVDSKPHLKGVLTEVC